MTTSGELARPVSHYDRIECLPVFTVPDSPVLKLQKHRFTIIAGNSELSCEGNRDTQQTVALKRQSYRPQFIVCLPCCPTQATSPHLMILALRKWGHLLRTTQALCNKLAWISLHSLIITWSFGIWKHLSALVSCSSAYQYIRSIQ